MAHFIVAFGQLWLLFSEPRVRVRLS